MKVNPTQNISSCFELSSINREVSQTRSISSLSSMRIREGKSFLHWVGEKIFSFLEWLFCCEWSRKGESSSFFRVDNKPDQEVKYRLIREGKKTDVEVKFSYKTASLTNLTFPGKKMPEEMGAMLRHALEEEKVDFLTTSSFEQAKLLFDLGLSTQSLVSVQLKSSKPHHAFVLHILKKAYEKAPSLSEGGKLALERCERSIFLGLLAPSLEPRGSFKDFLQDCIPFLQHMLPGFDAASVKDRLKEDEALNEWEKTTVQENDKLLDSFVRLGALTVKADFDIEVGLLDLLILLDEIEEEIPGGLRINPPNARFTKSS